MSAQSEAPTLFTEGVPQKRHEPSASTYGRNYWETESPLGGLTLNEWLRRASMRAANPLSRQQLILFLESSAAEFRNVDSREAESLGVLMGRLEGAGPIEVLLRSAPRADWLGSFIVGIAKTWRRGLSVVATAAEATSSGAAKTFVPALTRCLQESDPATRTAALSALMVLAARGDFEAFRAVELRCFATGVDPVERQLLVRGLLEAGTSAIIKSASGGTLQHAVDIAVGLVDVAAKTDQLPLLDAALGRLDPAVLPIEVSVALLASSRHFSEHLAARAEFGRQFVVNLRTRRHPEADKLLRFAR